MKIFYKYFVLFIFWDIFQKNIQVFIQAKDPIIAIL